MHQSIRTQPSRRASSRRNLITKALDYDPSTTNRGALEQLPENIIELIFSFLPLSRVFLLCWYSKDFYWPAVKRIYGHMAVIEKSLLQTWKPFARIPSEKFTIIRSHNLPQLFQTLSMHTNLARLIRSIALHGVHPENTLSLLSWAENLKELYDENSLCQMKKWFSSESLSFTLGTWRNKTSNLRELRIVESETGIKISYTKLASALIKRNCHNTIKVLVLEARPHEIKKSNCSTIRMPGYSSSTWIQFFRVLVQANVKLQLYHLGLPSNASVPNYKIRWLLRSINCQALHSLEIRHNRQISMDENEGRSRSRSILEALTQVTTHLRILSIDSFSCEAENEMNFLCAALRGQIRNKLEELSVTFHFHEKTLNDLSTVIFSRQKNLVRLKILHEKFLWDSECGSKKNMKLVKSMLVEDFNADTVRRQLSPRIYDTFYERPAFLPEHESRIRRVKSQLEECLKRDAIYTNCETKLPLLRHYFTGGFLVDVVNRGIHVNDSFIEFDAAKVTDV